MLCMHGLTLACAAEAGISCSAASKDSAHQMPCNLAYHPTSLQGMPTVLCVPRVPRACLAEPGVFLLFAAGLLHVFENGCSPPGDGVDDTPYCLPPKDESCPDSRDSCPQQPGLDPISNWMSYSVDSCMSSFSPGQLLRAERMWQRYRLPAG
jgi:hypothetical protein